MERTDIDGILRFSEEVRELKVVDRVGWKRRGILSPESVAEHSFCVAMLAMVLADIEGLDTLKVVKMSLLHDLAETRLLDLDPKAKRYFDKKTRQTAKERVMAEILTSLPQHIRAEYLQLWEEYEDGVTPESRLVKQVDSLEMLIQAKQYEEYGHVGLDEWWQNPYDFERIPLLLYKLLNSKRSAQKR